MQILASLLVSIAILCCAASNYANIVTQATLDDETYFGSDADVVGAVLPGEFYRFKRSFNGIAISNEGALGPTFYEAPALLRSGQQFAVIVDAAFPIFVQAPETIEFNIGGTLTDCFSTSINLDAYNHFVADVTNKQWVYDSDQSNVAPVAFDNCLDVLADE